MSSVTLGRKRGLNIKHMAYRPTEKTEARKAAVRQRVLDASLQIVSTGGFGALTVSDVAREAGIATGAVYKHFDSKAELCAEVFRLATEKELAVVKENALAAGSPSRRLLNAIEAFAARAISGRRLAYALIAEPVDTLVDAERLRYRSAYADIFRKVVEDGMEVGDFPQQSATVSAAALVGVISEALVGPLTWRDGKEPEIEKDELIRSIQAFCLRAVAMHDTGSETD
ncbi:MAG TPA: TetR/AcrR family transcriptional regulator [Noviherbaspirillum sp.]|nr:TetR/AcrR family transcriptional regulator [Noviherbaspirillum sp.]